MDTAKGVIEILRAAKAKVATGWIQGQNVSFEGDKVCAGHALVSSWQWYRAVQWDLASELHSLRQEGLDLVYHEVERIFHQAIEELFLDQRWTDIPPWNDAPGRTKEEVLATFDRALKIAERDG